jgi:hypothetical protein
MEEINRSAADLREAASLGEGAPDCEEMHRIRGMESLH